MSYVDENVIESSMPFGPEEYGIKSGWWTIDGEWFVVEWRAMRELHINKEKLKALIRTKKVAIQILTNPHNDRKFTVYSAEDLGIEGDGKIW